jgi:hypothetical protein
MASGLDLLREHPQSSPIQCAALIRTALQVFKLVKDARNTYGLRQQDHQKYR